MKRRFSNFLMFFIGFLLCLLYFLSPSQAGERSENELISAYLFNFAKFVEWPEHAFASKTSPIVLCIFGDDPFGEVLANLEMKKIKGRSLTVVRTHKKDQIKACHMLYVSESEKKDLPDILSKAANKPCLTVSSIDDFASQGGMIGFVRKGRNIRFEVNLDAIKRVELSVSSRLLNLAQIVKE